MAMFQRRAGEPARIVDPARASPQGSPEERALALDYPEHERSYALFTWLMSRFGALWLLLIFALILLYTV